MLKHLEKIWDFMKKKLKNDHIPNKLECSETSTSVIKNVGIRKH